MAEETTLSRKYVGALVIASIAVISLGLLARSRLIDPASPQSGPPSEASALQILSRENQLRGISAYVSERTAAIAPMIVRVPFYAASGLRWRAGDSVVTTSPDRAALLVQSPVMDSIRRVPALDADSTRRDWIVVVARDAGERVISWSGIAGGRSTVQCGGLVVEQLIIGPELSADFAGAGVFDLSGRLRGMIVRCDGKLVPVISREIDRLLADTTVVAADTVR